MNSPLQEFLKLINQMPETLKIRKTIKIEDGKSRPTDLREGNCGDDSIDGGQAGVDYEQRQWRAIAALYSVQHHLPFQRRSRIKQTNKRTNGLFYGKRDWKIYIGLKNRKNLVCFISLCYLTDLRMILSHWWWMDFLSFYLSFLWQRLGRGWKVKSDQVMVFVFRRASRAFW